MGVLDRKFRRLYHAHVQKHGAPVTLLIRSEETYNPVTGTVSGGETALRVHATRRNYDNKERRNETIEQDDFKLNVSGESVAAHEPLRATDVKVSISNRVYEVVNVTPHYSGGGLVDRYTLQVRA